MLISLKIVTIDSSMNDIKSFPVWMEGFSVSGQSEPAKYLGQFDADTFEQACKISIKGNLNWEDLYDDQTNTFWGMKFFDNEEEARKKYG